MREREVRMFWPSKIFILWGLEEKGFSTKDVLLPMALVSW